MSAQRDAGHCDWPVKQRSYDGREGGKVTMYWLEAADVGISLQRTTAKPVKAERAAGGNGGVPVQVCTKCGERHDRYGPDGRPCYLAPAKDEPPS